MGTAKRDRQRANRQLRLEQLEKEQHQAKRKRVVIRGAVLLVAFVAIALIFAATFGGGDDDDTAAATTTAAGASTSAGAATTAPAAPTTVPGATITGDTPCPAADGSAARTLTFEKAPPMCIDPAKSYTAVMETNKGSLTIALDAAEAPDTVNNFVVLARYHFFDGVEFHRIIPGFVIQGGDPTARGNGGPGYRFDDENLPASVQEYQVGSLAMANSGANTNGSQFFIVTAAGKLDGPKYSLFGQVTDGLDTTVKALEAAGSATGAPSEDVYITKVTITEA